MNGVAVAIGGRPALTERSRWRAFISSCYLIFNLKGGEDRRGSHPALMCFKFHPRVYRMYTVTCPEISRRHPLLLRFDLGLVAWGGSAPPEVARLALGLQWFSRYYHSITTK